LLFVLVLQQLSLQHLLCFHLIRLLLLPPPHLLILHQLLLMLSRILALNLFYYDTILSLQLRFNLSYFRRKLGLLISVDYLLHIRQSKCWLNIWQKVFVALCHILVELYEPIEVVTLIF